MARELTSTTLRACPKSDKLIEHYFLSADAHSYDEDVTIACLKDPTAAAWVFSASSHCDKSGETLPQMAFPREHVDPDPTKDGASPRIMTYRVGKYLVGETCRIEDEGAGRRAEKYASWSCESYQPSRPGTVVVTTVGTTTTVDDHDASKVFSGLMQPLADYTSFPCRSP